MPSRTVSWSLSILVGALVNCTGEVGSSRLPAQSTDPSVPHEIPQRLPLGDAGPSADASSPDSGLSTGDVPPGPQPPAPDAGGPPLDGATLRAACVAQVNALRASVALPPHAVWQEAFSCADAQAAADAAANDAHHAFGACGEFAQNECPGYTGGSPEQVVRACLNSMWAEGPEGSGPGEHGHYMAIVSSAYTQVACGIHRTAAGAFWIVVDFK